jgi:hypothetical protein
MWVERQAREILEKYVMKGDASADNFQSISGKDGLVTILDSHLKDGRYVCPTPCTKSYKLVGNFKRHLVQLVYLKTARRRACHLAKWTNSTNRQVYLPSWA